MIDFKATHETDNKIHFCNSEGETVKKYPMSELEKWVYLNGLNLNSESANGCISTDPNIIENEIETDLSTFIDDNWFDLTERFYNVVNKSGFKSENKPNQLNSKTL